MLRNELAAPLVFPIQTVIRSDPMIRRNLLALLLCLMPLSVLAQPMLPGTPKEGTDYVTLPAPQQTLACAVQVCSSKRMTSRKSSQVTVFLPV